jgi:hypothetical protein
VQQVPGHVLHHGRVASENRLGIEHLKCEKSFLFFSFATLNILKWKEIAQFHVVLNVESSVWVKNLRPRKTMVIYKKKPFNLSQLSKS